MLYEGGLGFTKASEALHNLLHRFARSTPLPGAARLRIAMPLLACLALGGFSTLHAQQPTTPTSRVPVPSAPAQTRKKVPPVPPGSMLPSYVATQDQAPKAAPAVPTQEKLEGWAGLKVLEIRFAGVSRSVLEPLPGELRQQPNTPLDPVAVRDSLRRLFATGLYQTVAVDGEKQAGGVILTFSGSPTIFVGRVLVRGVRNNQLNNQLNYSTRLNPGTPYNSSKLKRANNVLQQTLEDNGYYQAKIVQHTRTDTVNSQEDVQFNVSAGKPARVGAVTVQGDSGLTLDKFRKKAKLKADSKVNHNTVTRALTSLRKYYQHQQRLEPNVKLASKQFQPASNHVNYDFHDERGPVIHVHVEGVKLSRGKIKNLVPVYSEGTLDEDLLNEGSKRIRDYLQRVGYFDAKVTHSSATANGTTTVTYHVTLGPRERLVAVGIIGNRYFGTFTLRQRLSVQPASFFFPHGTWSLTLQQADIDAIKALYQNNGFTNVTVTPKDRETPSGKRGELDLYVTYHIEEGIQQRVGIYEIAGVTSAQKTALQPLLSLQTGQPYSGTNLAADRDAILGYFLDNGFDHAAVSVRQKPDPQNANLMNIHINVVPGDQTIIRRILISGLHYTRRTTIAPDILVKPGQPLDQAKLLETQRQLYNLTLFNQVNAAVQNPGGDQLRKNVLLQFDEARRWDVVYGAGFQAQTGTPGTNCLNATSLIQLGINPSSYACSPNGHFGVSALGELDVSRINLFGRNQTIGFHSLYGTLEQEITANYSWPRFFNHPTLDFSFGGGYINAQNIVTFASSTAEGDVRVTQRPNLVDTWIYQISYRRVRVDPNTVQVAPDEIPLLSEPVRVGGPELTWIHDTRRPEPLDANAGLYNSVQEFVTDNSFLNSQANYDHFDWSNASYYAVGREKNFVIARNTRFGMERVFGESKYENIPLPERLYAGGPESLRGFPLNSAGPRDSQTGFPIGGAGVFVNQTELRFPYPRLPYFGKSLGFVLFEDMGNVFNNSSDIWPSALRIKQPHSWTCKDPAYLKPSVQNQVTRSSTTNPRGTCNFNDFSHTVGVGVRYHTPIGPIRFDMGYNLNPPVYPITVQYATSSGSAINTASNTCANHSLVPPCVGQAGHWNFSFSIGQAF